MKANDFFATAETFPLAEVEAITRGGGLVVVAPHPDDESLGCGGLIAAACERQIAVRLIVVSDGTGSHAGSRSYKPDRLRDLREAETYAAANELGLSKEAITFLRLRDRYVPVEGQEAIAAVDAICAAAIQSEAGAICVSWHHDPHCDHVATARLAMQARDRLNTVPVFFYPIWGWTLPLDAEVGSVPRGVRFDISGYLDRKAAAIAAHRSQVTDLIDDDPNGFRLTDDMLAHFARPYEILLEAEDNP